MKTAHILACLTFLFFTVVQAYSQPISNSTDDQKKGLTADGGQWGYHKAQIVDNTLPRVLLIGDSILIGYRNEASLRLQGKANVDCFCIGAHIGSGDSLYKPLLSALQQGPYKVIHFNDIGLHGLMGRIHEGTYETLLRKYVDTIKTNSPGAILIWTTTTPMTVKGSPTQLDPSNATIQERNEIAARVMKDYGIRTDDLYSLMIDKLSLARGDQFHWTAPGQVLQGDQVAASIESALDSPTNKSP